MAWLPMAWGTRLTAVLYKLQFEGSNTTQEGIARNIKEYLYGYGSIPINTIFRGMNIHLPAILMFTRGTRFWHTAIWQSRCNLYISVWYLTTHVHVCKYWRILVAQSTTWGRPTSGRPTSMSKWTMMVRWTLLLVVCISINVDQMNSLTQYFPAL